MPYPHTTPVAAVLPVLKISTQVNAPLAALPDSEISLSLAEYFYSLEIWSFVTLKFLQYFCFKFFWYVCNFIFIKKYYPKTIVQEIRFLDLYCVMM